MSPPTVNAYYNPQINEIVFPAGILQPPFFDAEADDAYNYGGMGSVIGHEMTHGFDDQGSQFDATGNFNNWWTDADLKEFKERAECIVNQFNGFEVEKGLNQNGKLVVGESIADLGGLGGRICRVSKSHRRQAEKDRWLYAGTTLLPRLCARMGDQHASGTFAHADERRSPSTAEVSRQWSALEHAAVCRRVFMQGWRRDGSTREGSLSDLVNVRPVVRSP